METLYMAIDVVIRVFVLGIVVMTVGGMFYLVIDSLKSKTALNIRAMGWLLFMLIMAPVFLRTYPAVLLGAGAEGLANARPEADNLSNQLVDWSMDTFAPIATQASYPQDSPYQAVIPVEPTPMPTPVPAVTIIVVTATPTVTPVMEAPTPAPVITVSTPTPAPVIIVASQTPTQPVAEPTFSSETWNPQTRPPTPAIVSAP